MSHQTVNTIRRVARRENNNATQTPLTLTRGVAIAKWKSEAGSRNPHTVTAKSPDTWSHSQE